MPHRRATELAEEALFAVRKALVEGRAGYHHQAEDLLEALKILNGPSDGPDISCGPRAAGDDDFHAAVEAALDALHGRFLARVGGGRTVS